MKYIIFIICFLVLGLVNAQELNCNVFVNAVNIETSDRQVFQDMETNFAQFLNSRKWTEDEYQPEEKITCNIVISIESMPSPTSFTAVAQIQSTRPIYNTGYESVLLNYSGDFADKEWQFEYVIGQPLEFSDNVFFSNLTSMLAFYAYVVIGMDYDTFSNLGGSKYFEKARDVGLNVQPPDAAGWNQFASSRRNRYWIAENFNNQQMQGVREGIYRYHRLGLDIYGEKPDEACLEILSCLEAIQKVNRIMPNSILVTNFLYSKSNELINIFKKSELQLKRKAYQILIEVDPTKRDKYEEILKG